MNTSYIILIAIWASMLALTFIFRYLLKTYRRKVLSEEIRIMGLEMSSVALEIANSKICHALDAYKENPSLENRLKVWYFFKVANRITKVSKI